jgi:hypothetical protein
MNWVYPIPVVAVAGMRFIVALEIVLAVACFGAGWLTDWMGRRQEN